MQDTLVVAVKDEVFSRLDLLAAKLGVAVEYLWEVLISQASVEVLETILLCVFTTIFVALYQWGLRVYIKMWDDTDVNTFTFLSIMSVIGGILVVIFSATAISGLLQLPTLLMNPEYWALEQMRDLVK